jgi:tetratricopeptide (TPR) repeat protein
MKRTFLLVALAACGGGAQTTQTTTPAPAEPAPAAAPDEHAGHHEAAAGPSWKLDALPKGAVLLGDLGSHRRKVTTSSAEAQEFFDQGLRLTYGFNHDEAARSFARAAELDPKCAMCFWGAAYVLGPNYNVPMLPDRAEAAWDAIGRAQKLDAAPVEKALIAALAKRYKGPEWIDPVAQAPYNQAYADAMREVAKQFPDDDDVQTLFAEAVMNLNPWKLWAWDGTPAPITPEILATLETVLARAPQHPGANHYYIHAIEASKTPGKGEAAADRLGGLMPNAGHAVHMPAHIYQRVGRYVDASEANRRAIVSDRRYLDRVAPPGYYPFYLAHNHGFLAFSSSMLGRAAESLEAARMSATHIPKDIVCGMPGMDFFLSEPLLVMVRFGKWQEILAEPKPEAKYLVLSALWHHAHGMALASTGKAGEARVDLEAMRAIHEQIPAEQISDVNSSRAIVAVGAKVLEARIAEAEEKPEAIALWTEAVALEDKLDYAEPADWFYPSRHFLGAALLDARKPKEAEAVYRADLERNPRNGWALFGLWKSLAAQKKAKAARAAEADFKKAWAHADIALTRSAY